MGKHSMFEQISLAAGISLVVGARAVPAATADPLAPHRWKDRVVVIIAPDGSDPSLHEQRAAFAAARNGLKERDIVVLEAADNGSEATALRRKFAGPGHAFRAVLVGKDGGAKLTSDRPISAERLFGEIDAMPMRRQEMRER